MTSNSITPESLALSPAGFALVKGLKMAEGTTEQNALEWMRRRFRKHTPEDVRARIIRNKDKLLTYGIVGVGRHGAGWSEKPVLAVWMDRAIKVQSQLDAAWDALCEITDTVCETELYRVPVPGIEWWWPTRPETRAVLNVLIAEEEGIAETDIAARAAELGLAVLPRHVPRLLTALSHCGYLNRTNSRATWLRYAMWLSTGIALRRLVDRRLPLAVYSGGRREDDGASVPDLWLFAVFPDSALDTDLDPTVLADIGADLPCSFAIEAMRLSEFQHERNRPGTRAHFAAMQGVALINKIPES
jgi:hypothetical protein